MENLEKALDMLNVLNKSKQDIYNIKNSLGIDKDILNTESGNDIEAYYRYGFLTSLDSISNLGFTIDEDLTIETAITKKLSIIDKIKEMFKQKKVLIENKNVRITDKDIPESINSGEVAKEIFYGQYDFITNFVNNGKIDSNDLIGNFEGYYKKVESYYNKYLKDSKIFELEHLLSFSSSFIGHKFTDNLDILNNKSLLDIYTFNLDKIKLKDKQDKLNVIEYRYLFLSFEVNPTIYVIKYIKAGDLIIANIDYAYGKLKDKINTVSLKLTKEDIMTIIVEKKYDDSWFQLPENKYVYEGSNTYDKFFTAIDEILSKNKNIDISEINKIHKTSFDYWDEYEIEDEHDVSKNTKIKKYLFNICYDNYYDNVEQGHHGNILNYNYYWNIVANIIDLYKKGKLGK